MTNHNSAHGTLSMSSGCFPLKLDSHVFIDKNVRRGITVKRQTPETCVAGKRLANAHYGGAYIHGIYDLY